MNELFNRIIAWHEKNLPEVLPYEPLPQIGFLIEELGEVNKEFIKGDIDKAVGEITDLIVFSVNAIKLLNPKLTKHVFNYEIVPKQFQLDDNLHIITGLLDAITGVAAKAHDFKNSRVLPNHYFEIVERSCTFIESLGYSCELALLETVKKIESRRGAWNPEIGKWEKEKNQADVYTPDYFKAKIKKDGDR